jgi:hypothetical protein
MTGCKQMQQKSNGLMESFPSRSFCVPYPNFFLSSYVKNARSLLFFECRCGILPYSSCCSLTIPVTKPCSPALSTNHKSSADSEDQGSVSEIPAPRRHTCKSKCQNYPFKTTSSLIKGWSHDTNVSQREKTRTRELEKYAQVLKFTKP